MTVYTVRWEAQIEADDETAAARAAAELQSTYTLPGSFAVFHVIEDEKVQAWPEAGWAQIDLNSDPEDNADDTTEDRLNRGLAAMGQAFLDMAEMP